MPESLAEFLGADHRRLDAIVLEVQQAVTGAPADAAAAFSRFAEGLDRHIRAEEDVLFPAFEGATGMVAGPTQVMRNEHAEMRRLLAEVSSALGSGEMAAALRTLPALVGLLAEHNMKEETVLYPMAGRSLPNAREVMDRMRAVLKAGQLGS